MPTKSVRIMVLDFGDIVFDKTVAGKKYKNDLIREAAEYVNNNSTSGHVYFRVQEIGARGWAYYIYRPGEKMAHLLGRDDREYVEELFDAA